MRSDWGVQDRQEFRLLIVGEFSEEQVKRVRLRTFWQQLWLTRLWFRGDQRCWRELNLLLLKLSNLKFKLKVSNWSIQSENFRTKFLALKTNRNSINRKLISLDFDDSQIRTKNSIKFSNSNPVKFLILAPAPVALMARRQRFWRFVQNLDEHLESRCSDDSKAFHDATEIYRTRMSAHDHKLWSITTRSGWFTTRSLVKAPCSD